MQKAMIKKNKQRLVYLNNSNCNWLEAKMNFLILKAYALY